MILASIRYGKEMMQSRSYELVPKSLQACQILYVAKAQRLKYVQARGIDFKKLVKIQDM
jgi:hypothetical protein